MRSSTLRARRIPAAVDVDVEQRPQVPLLRHTAHGPAGTERKALQPSLAWRHLSANLHGMLSGRMRGVYRAAAGASPFGETTDSAPPPRSASSSYDVKGRSAFAALAAALGTECCTDLDCKAPGSC